MLLLLLTQESCLLFVAREGRHEGGLAWLREALDVVRHLGVGAASGRRFLVLASLGEVALRNGELLRELLR